MNHQQTFQEPSIHIGAYTRVSLTEIVYCEGDRNYTHVHFAARPKMTLSVTMRILQERLGEANFLRVNRSALVNKAAVFQFNEDHVILRNGLVLPIARRRRGYVRRHSEDSRDEINT